ncbi:hypothetical protein CDL12_11828 [Handroanthus impetiginosus]|uniref:Uncharacterized protein n=1 Tax=Handroanthus impetiginosus TaxID=429701 RepID=A0A2G9HDE1_9LAMI|nr:hypothetical protein CDL12_11828 [Handroanthus impetiginosus]
MKCINSHTLPSPLFSQHLKHNHQISPANRPSIVQIDRNGFFSVSLRTKALHAFTVLATSFPSTGKLSVLLQTSAVCLFAYWVVNFVVPGMILKDLQSNKKNGEEDER